MGKHILFEKPIADSLEVADRILDAVSEEDVVLMVGENARFDPVVERIRDLLKSDAIGAPALAQVTREADLGESFRGDRRWFLDEEQAAGGIMLSGGIHDIEKLRAVLDAEVKSIHARRPRQRIDDMDGDDTSVATVRFDDGTVGVLVESFAMKSLETVSGDEVHSLHIDGDRGSIAVEGDGPIRVFSEDDVVP